MDGEQQETAQAPVADAKDQTSSGGRRRQRIHWHVALTHFPISLFGTAFLFQILHLFMFSGGFEAATTVCVLAGSASMIPATVTGWFTWKRHYRGATTRIFTRKRSIAFGMLGLSVALSAWRLSLYSIGQDTSTAEHYAFFFLCLALILGAVAEGYFGGRLAHH